MLEETVIKAIRKLPYEQLAMLIDAHDLYSNGNAVDTVTLGYQCGDISGEAIMAVWKVIRASDVILAA